MTLFSGIDSLARLCDTLPSGSVEAANAVRARQDKLTKPPGSLGRLEQLVAWMARWQERPMPQLDRVDIVVFAGNHGVVAQGVSPYPASVTAQMVANFERGGAAINQLARNAGAALHVVPIALDQPAGDVSQGAAMDEAAFLAALNLGATMVEPGIDLLCLGEMGIGNTTAAACLCAALFGGGGRQWAGRGTGLDADGVAHKAAIVDRALAANAALLTNPWDMARVLGGRELAAILGAVIAARLRHVPVLLDGFVCTAAAAPLDVAIPGGLAHAVISHLSAESGHHALAAALGLDPLLSLDMRLGEASGAALAVPILRAALACHADMATFAEASVSGPAG
jgi:nicotinate-nucleotide--dimethylbenzimidazole phosphoribosyltransferase